MTDKLAELGRHFDFDRMGFTLEAWRLMDKLGIRLRLPEAGDKYGPLFLEDTSSRIVCHYDMLERRMWFQYFDHLLADMNGVAYQRIVTLVSGYYRLNAEQLREDAFKDVLQQLHDAFIQKYPGRSPSMLGPAWGLLVSRENRDQQWQRATLDLNNCLALLDHGLDFASPELSVLQEQYLPVAAVSGLHEGLATSLLHELYGTYRWQIS